MWTVRQAPVFTPKEAEVWARAFWGLEARAAELPSERDQNFLLTVEGSRRFVLKIANASEDPAVLDLQNRAMLHLASAPDSPPCSRLVPCADGRATVAVSGPEGKTFHVRMVTFIDGAPLASVRPQTPELLFDLGCFTARLVRGLSGFVHPQAHRALIWDMQKGPEVVREYARHIPSGERRELVDTLLRRYEEAGAPWLASLAKSVIHNDGNDHNVIVSPPERNPDSFGERRVAGIIDFGDIVHSYTLAELGVVCSYVMLDKDEPLAAAARVISGYDAVLPLGEAELDALFHLICLRLMMSAAICAYQMGLKPENDYLSISNPQVWRLLEKLAAVPPNFAAGVFRKACGLSFSRESGEVVRWLGLHGGEFAPVTGFPLAVAKRSILDLSVGSLLLEIPKTTADVGRLTDLIFGKIKADGASVGVGRYNEARLIFASALLRPKGAPLAEGPTVHLGIDLFIEPGTPLFIPWEGKVHGFSANAGPLDYGPTIILEHEVETDGVSRRFYTLYDHLAADALDGLQKGKMVKKGERFASVGSASENGGWPPHLHFQIILDMLGREGDFPGVCRDSEKDVWLELCPDPNLILGIPRDELSGDRLEAREILSLRRSLIGKSLSLSYRRPIEIVRGFGRHLYDRSGRMYLDAVNNVAHVGHSHPAVVEAVRRQIAVLNTNTRYLHENLVQYAKRLTATLPQPLSVCYIVNSGSEANDLALRMARTYTGQTDIIVLEGAYHGHLTSLIEISPYKFDSPGGPGRPPSTQKVALPDLFRGPFRSDDPEASHKYALQVREAVARVGAEGRGVAGFICESLPSCGGQIVLPDGYLAEAYRFVREAGGLCLADEVQVGLGRVGSHFWGFETQGVVPDIVTMGKSIGNGFPLAAVVTTPRISEAFANGLEYFNTYGGNPVSCAAGLAVLDVLEREGLPENALNVGGYLKSRLLEMAGRHPLIGDVRGLGLFLGVELVTDLEKRSPAAPHADYVVNRLREEGILASRDGPDRNVIKIKPPLVFGPADADLFIATLDRILDEDPVALE